jgi:hypothetical protein
MRIIASKGAYPMKKKTQTPKTMKLTEGQRVLDVSYGTIWKMARRGDIPTVEIGGRLFILRQPFMALFK